MLLLGVRHRGKQPQRWGPARFGAPVAEAVAGAIVAEALACDGLMGLPVGTRTCNVHFTHSRTNNARDVQPDQITRQRFWQILCRCFQEAYPKADSITGSILAFGLVCKELHKDAPREEDRSEHHHAATHATEKFLWKKIRQIAAERYHIQLNAVAHATYTTMFCYLRCPTAKKKVHELDATPFYSLGHPQGEKLAELLQLGDKYKQVRAGKATSEAPGSSVPVRSQFGTVFNWVTEHKLGKRKGAAELEAAAVTELKAGRPQMIEFCKKHKGCLQDQIEYIWSLETAQERIVRLDKSRLDLLVDAASPYASQPQLAEQCKNGSGVCQETYEAILRYQGIESVSLRHEIFETLRFGRRKGNALMLVGGKDTGKTTLTQPLELIYKTMKRPQADSFCPLEKIRGHELLLWQDFRYNPGHPKGKDEAGLRLDIGTWNILLEGLPTSIGVPKSDGSKSDFVYEEDAPLIATGPFQPTGYKDGVPNEKETEQLTCRMKFTHFRHPAPGAVDRSFKPCPLCWGRWVLLGEIAWCQSCGEPLDDMLSKVSTALAAPPSVVEAAAAPSVAPVAPRVAAHDEVPPSGRHCLLEEEGDVEAEALLRELDDKAPVKATLPEVPMVPGMNCPAEEVQATDEGMDSQCSLVADASEALRVLQKRQGSQSDGKDAAPQIFFHELKELVAWRRDGLLTHEQFEKAKTKLGL